jgi:hypothetical protein
MLKFTPGQTHAVAPAAAPRLHSNCESQVRRKSLIAAAGDQLSTKRTHNSQGVSQVLWEWWEKRVIAGSENTGFPVALNCTAAI